jgi:hypothetical protein
MDPREILAKIAKGAIAPADLSVGGVLEQEIAQRFIDLVVDESEFLKRISIKRVGKIEGAFKLLDIADEVLVRVAQGNDPADEQRTEPSRQDVSFVNKSAQLFFQLLFDTIDDNQKNPNFETELEGMFARKFSNDLTRLGFVGVADDYAGSAFARLNKGWLQVAKDGAPLAQRVNTSGATTVKEMLDDTLKAMPDKYKRAGLTTFIVNRTDWEDFCDELGASAASVMAQILLDGKLPQYKGYPLLPMSQMPQSTLLFSGLGNYWMTMLTEIKRFREVRGTKRCIDYTFDLSNDYGLANPNAVVVAWDQGY